MKDGCARKHKHRYLRVRRDGRVHRTLKMTVHTTCDREQAESSRYAYRLVEYTPPGWDFVAYEYVLSLLGLLHGLVGLTVVFDD